MEVQAYADKGLIVLDEKEESLKELAEQFKGLTVNGLEDKEGFKRVRDARITLKNERVAIENMAKQLRDPAIQFQRTVIAREKQLVAIIEPIEDDLYKEEARIKQLKEEAREAKERAEARVLQDRIDALAKYNFAADWMEVKHLNDEEFAEMLAHAKSLHEEQLNREAEIKAEEERQRKVEEERLRAEREELAKQKAEQEARELELRKQEQERIEAERKRQEEVRAEREKLEAERRAIEEEKRKHEEAVRLEQARKEAAERARQEEQERVRREAEEKAERERVAKLEAERQEALRPDKDKMIQWANEIMAFRDNAPELKDSEAKMLITKTVIDLHDLSNWLMKEANHL